MKERTEADMLAMAPLVATFGQEEYFIPILTVIPSREWRLKLNEQLAGITNSFAGAFEPGSRVEAESEIKKNLTLQLIEFPEKIAELIFAYAKDLPRDKILESASEEQLAEAFAAIMGVAYPYLRPLMLAMRATRGQMPKSPAMAKSLN